jgi:hypothetical protein
VFTPFGRERSCVWKTWGFHDSISFIKELKMAIYKSPVCLQQQFERYFGVMDFNNQASIHL